MTSRIKDIVALPETFRNTGNKSIIVLLKETGYFNFYNEITEDNIFKELLQNPQYIEGWLMWSEGKRSDKGWFFMSDKYGRYIVGYSSLGTNQEVLSFPDKTRACAAFIKREIEDIRIIL